MSPFKFITMVEALNRSISHSKSEGLWKGVRILHTPITITHTLFADGTLLFGEENLRKASHIKAIWDCYEFPSNQKSNASKSTIFIFHTNADNKRSIINFLGFKEAQLTCAYLDIPFFMGSSHAKYWQNVIDRLNAQTKS